MFWWLLAWNICCTNNWAASDLRGQIAHVTSLQYLDKCYHCAIHWFWRKYIDGFVQNCSISMANTLKILQSCTKPLIFFSMWSFYSACLRLDYGITVANFECIEKLWDPFTFLWYVISHSCPNFNGNWFELLLNLGYRWLITFHCFMWM